MANDNIVKLELTRIEKQYLAVGIDKLIDSLERSANRESNADIVAIRKRELNELRILKGKLA